MLEQLFGSRTRIKLLKIFFGEPDKSFFIRELCRKSGERLNSIRRELANLQKMGVVKLYIQGEGDTKAEDTDFGVQKQKTKKIKKQDQDLRKYFVIDHSFALFSELKNLILKSQLAIKKDLAEEVQKAGTIKLLLLTGFFVGDLGGGPDLLIIGSLNRDRLRRLVGKFEKIIGQEIKYTVLSLNDYHVRQSITDKFLYNIISGKKIVVVNKLKELML